MKKAFYLNIFSMCLLTAAWSDPSSLPSQKAPEAQERVTRRQTALDSEQKLILKQKRTAEEASDQEQNSESPFRRAALNYNPSQKQFQFAPTNWKADISLANFSNFIPDYTHWLVNIGPTGHTIEMEDGTQWEIHPSDTYVLNMWRKNDPMIVTPNNNWFSTGDFYITNKNNNSYVRADLVVSPIAFGPYSHWIIGIDYSSGHVYLENGTTWCMSPSDYSVFKDWAVNDHIVMGYNDAWLSPYDRILINYNMDSYVRAKQY